MNGRELRAVKRIGGFFQGVIICNVLTIAGRLCIICSNRSVYEDAALFIYQPVPHGRRSLYLSGGRRTAGRNRQTYASGAAGCGLGQGREPESGSVSAKRRGVANAGLLRAGEDPAVWDSRNGGRSGCPRGIDKPALRFLAAAGPFKDRAAGVACREDEAGAARAGSSVSGSGAD